MYGSYRGRSLITFDVDYSKLSDEQVMFSGSAMKDNICDNISFEDMPYEKNDAKVGSRDPVIESDWGDGDID